MGCLHLKNEALSKNMVLKMQKSPLGFQRKLKKKIVFESFEKLLLLLFRKKKKKESLHLQKPKRNF